MTAAIIAADNGHSVLIVEKSDKYGGDIRYFWWRYLDP